MTSGKPLFFHPHISLRMMYQCSLRLDSNARSILSSASFIVICTHKPDFFKHAKIMVEAVRDSTKTFLAQ